MIVNYLRSSCFKAITKCEWKVICHTTISKTMILFYGHRKLYELFNKSWKTFLTFQFKKGQMQEYLYCTNLVNSIE